MSIKNLEIKPSEAKAVEIASLPTRPTSSATYGGRGLTAQEMKKAYDAYPALIKERFNDLIADLLSGIAISDIPFSIPSHEPFGENIEQTVKGFLDAVGSILDFGTDNARTIFGFVKQFISDVAKATSLEYDNSTQLLKLTIDGEEKSVTIDFSYKFDQFETAIAELRSTLQTLDATKFDKSGGGITGDVHIGGSVYIGKDLTVAGNSIIQEAEHLQVKDAVIVMNKDGEILTVPAGSVIRKGVNADGVDEIYAIMYDPVSDSVKLGLVYQDENGNYQFLAGEGYPVATRADSSSMQDGMFAVWDATNRRFVTSDVSSSDVNSKLDAVSTNNIIYATDAYGNQTVITYAKGYPDADNVPVMDDQARLYAVTTGEEPMGTPLSDLVLANRYYVDAADNRIKDTVSKQAADIELLYTLIENTIITLTEVEDTYTTRVTAGGLPVVDDAPATVHAIKGATAPTVNLIDETLLLPWTIPTDTTAFTGKTIPFKIKAGTYTVSNRLNGTVDIPNVLAIVLMDSSMNEIVSCNSASLNSINTSATFTVTQEQAEQITQLYFYFNTETTSALRGLTVAYFMLNAGSTALPHEAYYAGLKSATFAGITSTGRNLLEPSADRTDTADGVTYQTTQATGEVHITGTPTARNGAQVFNDIHLPGGGCTLYLPHAQSGTSWYVRNSTREVASLDAGTTHRSVYFGSDADEVYSVYVYVETTVGTIDYTETPMLLYGSVTENFPSFETYRADTSFALAEPLALGKWDHIDIANGEKVVQTETITLTGDDTTALFINDSKLWIKLSNLISNDSTSGKFSAIVCNHYDTGTYDRFFMSDKTIVCGTSAAEEAQYIIIRDDACSTLEDFVQQFAAWNEEGNPLTIAFQTATETRTDVAVPKTYKVWRNGTETVDMGNADALTPTITQTYYEEVTA